MQQSGNRESLSGATSRATLGTSEDEHRPTKRLATNSTFSSAQGSANSGRTLASDAQRLAARTDVPPGSSGVHHQPAKPPSAIPGRLSGPGLGIGGGTPQGGSLLKRPRNQQQG